MMKGNDPKRRPSPRRPRPTDSLRRQYDFRGGVRGKYARRYARGTNLILLDPDIAPLFRDSKAVNRALRAYLRACGRIR
jgi:hypothetical protein